MFSPAVNMRRLFTESQVSPGAVMFSNGVPYTYQNGMAVFASPETGYVIPQAQTAFMDPHTPPIYMQQTYSYHRPTSYSNIQMNQYTSSCWPLNSLGTLGNQPGQYPMHPTTNPNPPYNGTVFYNLPQIIRPPSLQPSVYEPRHSKRLPIIDPISGEDITAKLRPVGSETGISYSNTSRTLVNGEGVTVSVARSDEENMDLAQQSIPLLVEDERIDFDSIGLQLEMILQETSSEEEEESRSDENKLVERERIDRERTDHELAMYLQEMSSDYSSSEEENGMFDWDEQFDSLSSDLSDQVLHMHGMFDWGEQIGRVPSGLSDQDCSRLPTKIYEKIEDTHSDCSICYEDYVKGDAQTTLPCLHVYHPNCIKTWLLESATCPNCRQQVNVD